MSEAVNLDKLAGALRDNRRPDVAVGMLLARELVSNLLALPDDYARVAAIALGDLAATVYDDAEQVLVELLACPDGDYVDEDNLGEQDEW